MKMARRETAACAALRSSAATGGAAAAAFDRRGGFALAFVAPRRFLGAAGLRALAGFAVFLIGTAKLLAGSKAGPHRADRSVIPPRASTRTWGGSPTRERAADWWSPRRRRAPAFD